MNSSSEYPTEWQVHSIGSSIISTPPVQAHRNFTAPYSYAFPRNRHIGHHSPNPVVPSPCRIKHVTRSILRAMNRLPLMIWCKESIICTRICPAWIETIYIAMLKREFLGRFISTNLFGQYQNLDSCDYHILWCVHPILLKARSHGKLRGTPVHDTIITGAQHLMNLQVPWCSVDSGCQSYKRHPAAVMRYDGGNSLIWPEGAIKDTLPLVYSAICRTVDAFEHEELMCANVCIAGW